MEAQAKTQGWDVLTSMAQAAGIPRGGRIVARPAETGVYILTAEYEGAVFARKEMDARAGRSIILNLHQKTPDEFEAVLTRQGAGEVTRIKAVAEP